MQSHTLGSALRIRLDLLGGMAGDMFMAALLDAFPEHLEGVLQSISVATGAQVRCALVPFNDGVLQGHRFDVSLSGTPAESLQTDLREGDAGHSHAHAHPHSHGHSHATAHRPAHDHTQWSVVREGLRSAGLSEGILKHALGIFGLLADAEAKVHGIDVEEVAFHEVGAWDSIADIVGAAHLIDAVSPASWSVGAVPLGSGRVQTAHGLLPVPAPATTALLAGFLVIDDGVPGERVTPTGAAILAHLCGGQGPSSRLTREPERLRGSGIGFGTRQLPGMSNCVRVLVSEPTGSHDPTGHRQLAVVEFEVDDQSAEDLAMGLDQLRAHPHVFDVVQQAVFGKKGRMMTAIRALAAPASLDAVIDACFRETTTIGLRYHLVHGAALTRSHHEVTVEDRVLKVKVVQRPGGATAKTESDEVRAQPGHATRHAVRLEAQRVSLLPVVAVVAAAHSVSQPNQDPAANELA